MNRLATPWLAFAFILLALSPAGAQPKTLTDDEIRTRVENELEEDDILSVDVAVSGGVVTLSGSVPSAWAAQRAVHSAEKVRGVKSVVSHLKVAAAESDSALAEEVANKVRQSVFYTIFDHVTVAVKDGVVALGGQVVDSYTARDIVENARRLPGVREVVNQIEILPASGFDQQIRAEVASRIYNDPVLARHGGGVDPSIHVIVKNGHVTLVGVVDTELARRKAELIANGVAGVFSVKNQLTTEK
jgi:hyperosmotically inducible protein